MMNIPFCEQELIRTYKHLTLNKANITRTADNSKTLIQQERNYSE
jgi:hypothetical protein